MTTLLAILGWICIALGILMAWRTVNVWPRSPRPELGWVLMTDALVFVITGIGLLLIGGPR